MTQLPEKNILDGSRVPATTTGEMKNALGKLRDYLDELLGDDSGDKEAARLSLGIDLAGLIQRIEAKADEQGIQDAIRDKADRAELDSKVQELAGEIARRGTPIGSIEYFAVDTPPAGYLTADGSEVGRETYADLFAAIGTTYGVGNGQTTFNLPDLIGRFAQGSATPGIRLAAGLPNITGNTGANSYNDLVPVDGAFKRLETTHVVALNGSNFPHDVYFDASLSNGIYGSSDTVQPPALTLLPCIKAFNAATDSGLIDISGLANEVAGKAASDLSNVSHDRFVGKTILSAVSKDMTGVASFEMTDIPEKAMRVTVNLHSLTCGGRGIPSIRLVTSDGIVATGYRGSSLNVGGTNNISTGSIFSTEFRLCHEAGSGIDFNGSVTLNRHGNSSNTWSIGGMLGRTDNPFMGITGGSIQLDKPVVGIVFMNTNAENFRNGIITFSLE